MENFCLQKALNKPYLFNYVKLGKGLGIWLAAQWASDVHKRHFYGPYMPEKEVCPEGKSKPRMLVEVGL